MLIPQMMAELRDQVSSLYTNDRLERWATEQLEYCEKVLTKIKEVTEVIEADKASLGVAEEQLKAMFITTSGRKPSER